jgi:Uma2 family endonuclease
LVTITAHGPATYEDLLKLPENVVGEILDGELYSSPRPTPRHGRAESAFHSRIFARYDDGISGPGGWWIMFEPEIHLGADVVVPDVAGWRRERMPVFPETAWLDLAPDWACEVLSPSTRRLDRLKKLPIYARERVPFTWFVDPLERTVEIFKLVGDTWQLVHVYGGDEQMAVPPFEELTIDLRTMWV